jgi:HK97 family phage prohead protease
MFKDESQYKSMGVPFELKAEDVNDDGTFKGWGSAFDGPPDDHDDIVIKGAFKQTILKGGRNRNGVAMLYQHNAREPIGVWTKLEEKDRGLYVEGKLAIDNDNPQKSVQRAMETHLLMKMGALKGLSIGYDLPRLKTGEIDPESYERLEKPKGRWIRYLKKLDLWEISPVTFPANTRATVTTVKDFQGCTNERDLECRLRDAGLSRNAAAYIISLLDKSALRESGPQAKGGYDEYNEAVDLLNKLRERNARWSDF